MAANNESIVSSTVESGSGAFNCSLLQGGTLTKIIVGGIVGTAVVVAGVITGTVIGTRAQSSPPVANPVFESTFKNIPISFDPTENDIAIEDENTVDPALISLDNVNNPVNGSISWSAVNKTVSYFPDPGFVGSEVFAYTISNDKRSAEGTINVTVVNRPPVAQDDNYGNVGRNTEVLLDVLTNDSDADNDTLIITDYPAETEMGTLTLQDSAIKYTTKDGQFGNEDFMYTISDGNATSTARVYINIVNNPPTARPDHYSVLMNGGAIELNVLANDEDENGDVISLKSVGMVDNGKFETQNGFVSSISSATSNNITYVPNWNSPTNDAFDYTITDNTNGDNSEAFATVSIEVINKPPTAGNYSFEMMKTESNYEIPLYELIGDENPYTCLDVSVPSSRGTVTLDSQSTSKTVQYQGEERSYNECQWIMKYTPENGKSYKETFRYVVSDGFETATGFITVRSTNRDPVAQSKTVTLPHVNAPENDPALEFQVDMSGLVSDPDGDDVEIIRIDSFSMLGEFQGIDENKVATFTRKSGFYSTETQRYYIKDIQEDTQYSGEASALLTIELTNEGPTCEDRVIETDKNNRDDSVRLCVASPCTVCSDPENDKLNVTGFVSATGWANARHVGNDVVIDVPAYTSGNESVTYIVSDGTKTTQATIHVVVWNEPPSALPGSVTISRDSQEQCKTLDLSNYVSDGDNDILTISGIGKSEGSTSSSSLDLEFASAQLKGNKVEVCSTKNSTRLREDFTFYYTVSDGDQNYPSTATNSIDVTIKSNPPTAQDLSKDYDQGSQFDIDLKALGLVQDPDNDFIKLVNVGYDNKQQVQPQFTVDGVITYPSQPNFCDRSSFEYEIETVDGTASATITLSTLACQCDESLDVMFVFDRSGSVSNNWDEQLDFGRSITQALDVGPTKTRVGIVSFSSRWSVSLDKGLTGDPVTAMGNWDWVEQNRGPGGSTATGEGIKKAESEFNDNGRTDVARLYIVISDGIWNNGIDPVDEANAIRDQGNDSRFVSIAIGQTGFGASILRDIADSDENYLAPNSYAELINFTYEVVDRACQTNSNQ
eukprot:gb/GECH01011056.1/.p1 GENE.gb/GECH01011056.1/~~gb/GECH01011056.1/.p1  ORF type:complete len:1063 (+),score=230.34 gb/GECH01011056.1/:1-3189(+)